jgi:hypothetical protein
MIDLHQGEPFHHPSFETIEVIGTELTSELQTVFEELGLTAFQVTNVGFRAAFTHPIQSSASQP